MAEPKREWRIVGTRKDVDGILTLDFTSVEALALVYYRQWTSHYARFDTSLTVHLQSRTVTEWEDTP